MHSDLYRTYTDKLTRCIVTHEGITTRLLLISQTNVCVDTYDKNNLSPLLIIHNVVVVFHQKPEPNHFPMRIHFEQQQQHNLSLYNLTANELVL